MVSSDHMKCAFARMDQGRNREQGSGIIWSGVCIPIHWRRALAAGQMVTSLLLTHGCAVGTAANMLTELW